MSFKMFNTREVRTVRGLFVMILYTIGFLIRRSGTAIENFATKQLESLTEDELASNRRKE